MKTFDDIETIEDYLTRKRLAVKTGEAVPIALPASDVVKVLFRDGSWFAVRPSGTEPKLKLYFSGVGKTKADAEKRMSALKAGVLRFIGEPEKLDRP
jgi:phosphoglucomutase